MSTLSKQTKFLTFLSSRIGQMAHRDKTFSAALNVISLVFLIIVKTDFILVNSLVDFKNISVAVPFQTWEF